ncbi:hypothetical protein [Mycobacterium riyadhense]|nr:hypothetical protein [Mycobacterium riyadhense]
MASAAQDEVSAAIAGCF